MYRNYLKTAFRFLKQNRLFTFINAFGLSLALAVSFLILLFVINELSYDHGHKDRKRIFRVVNTYSDSKHKISSTPYTLASSLKEEFPQVEKAVRVLPLSISFKPENGIISATAIGTDSEVTGIFTIPMVGGGRDNDLLENKNSILLSADLASRIFHDQNPVGKEISGTLNNEEHLFTVTGVFENLPENTTFKAECLINSWWTVDYINKKFNVSNSQELWDKDFWITWILVAEKTDVRALEKQFKDFEAKKFGEKQGSHYSLQNLSDVYLGSEDIANSGIKGSLSKIEIFSAIALLILIVATINYILLSTAVSTGRTLEIGVRKTYGAGIGSIRNQLLTETFLLISMVLPFAFLIMRVTLPLAEKLFQTQLNIIKSNIGTYILVYLLLTVLIGFASGIYTSAYLSKLNVLAILKNPAFEGKRKYFFRSALIVLQLIIFCSFLSGMLIIRAQYQYLTRKDLGYKNSNILLVNLGRDFKDFSAYINSIRSNPDVIMASGTMEGLPMMNTMSISLPNFHDNTKMVEVEIMGVDFDFIKTMGISVIDGRAFSPEFGSDLNKSSLLLNETAVKELGLTEPIGKVVASQTVIGVVRDFNLHSLYSGIPPLAIVYSDRVMRQIAVNYKPGTLGHVLPVLENEWKVLAPDKPFQYTTIEEVIGNLYSSEKNLTAIVTIFAILTLIISAFGLFGLTLYVARTRTKEIGIKKVFGSTESAIVFSFLRSDFFLITIASIISIPLTLHFMNNWLGKFPFKIVISGWVFVSAYLVALFVVLMTVFFHSWKASRNNPVNALRHE